MPPLDVPVIEGNQSPSEFIKSQERDETLYNVLRLGKQGVVKSKPNGATSQFVFKNGILFRRFSSPKVRNGHVFMQVVVPKSHRSKVMAVAHESPMSGHMAAGRTKDRVREHFYWPGVDSDIIRFCRSCDICQKTFPKGKVPRAPLFNDLDYRIRIGKKVKVYHINMLKLYVEREPNCGSVGVANVSVITCSTSEDEVSDLIESLCPTVKSSETLDDVKFGSDLSPDQVVLAKQTLTEFTDILTDLPGKTDVVQHNIVLTTEKPIRTKQYPLPFKLQDILENEIVKMEKLGIIEDSYSPYCSALLLVKKPDGTNRVCIDFRPINRVTVFDAEPMGDPELLFTNLAGAKYLTQIDLTKTMD
ncbi:uncharacterized protein LOC141915138 [Tubulanus polymorphus]|uniref:uncharacterized protein LOC141915138 n=1 Tax=Tubulanus polymorphus TaxID=672921 RepID=UPI003DA5CF63